MQDVVNIALSPTIKINDKEIEVKISERVVLCFIMLGLKERQPFNCSQVEIADSI